MPEERQAKIEPTIEGCSHWGQIQDVTPSAQGCEDCLKIGDTWVPSASVPDLRSRRLLR
jgi:hypothetical protein